MMISVPLGDARVGHQNGPNLHKLPPRGNEASQILQRALMQRTGIRMVSDVTGNFKAVLAAKDVCNDTIAVFLGDRKSLVYQALGQAFNISFAHQLNVRRLFDQILVVTARPAVEARKNVRPRTAAVNWFERDFHRSIREALMTIPGDVVNTIEQLKTHLASFDTVGGNDNNHENELRIHDKYDKLVREIEAILAQCFSTPAYTLKKAMEQGTTDHAHLTLIRSAITFPLVGVLQRFASSIAENRENHPQLRKTLLKELAKKSCESVFMLAKSPETFFAELIDAGINSVKKIAHVTGIAAVYDPVTNIVTKVDGVIILSHQAFQFVTMHPMISKLQLQNGFLVDKKPAFYKPVNAFTENDPTKSVIMLYDDDDGDNNEQHFRDTEALEELIKTLRESSLFPPNRTQGTGVIDLTSSGKKILAGNKEEDGKARRSTQTRYQLGTYEIKEQCQYVMHRNKAYIVDHSREYMPICDQPDPYGRSPSLVAVKQVIFRTSLGDIFGEHEQLYKWITTAVTSNGLNLASKDADPITLFESKPVMSYTPGLSPECKTFGANETRTAFMDPNLYDHTKLEEALNINLVELNNRHEAHLHWVKGMFLKKLTTAQQHEGLFKRYCAEKTVSGEVHSKGQVLESLLLSIELHPHFDVRTEADGLTNKLRFKLRKRNLFGQLPAYVVPLCVTQIRALLLLARGFSEIDIYNLNDKLATAEILKPGEELKSDETNIQDKIGNAAEKLRSMFTKIFTRHPHTPDKVNFLFEKFKQPGTDETDDPVDMKLEWFIIKYVVLPVVYSGCVKFSNDSVDDKVVKGDIVTVTPAPEEFTMFTDDKLFDGDNYVMSSNMYWIVAKSGWPPVLQAAALMTLFFKLDPTTYLALISEGFHTGWSVDFIRSESIYSEQAVFAPVGSHEMIVSPGGVKENEKGDGSVDLVVSVNIHTTTNTLTAGSVLVPSAFPNENGVPRAQNAAGKPILTQDNVTRTEYGSLTNALAANTTLTDDDRTAIREQLNQPTRPVGKYGHAFGGNEEQYADEYVPMIRPVSRPNGDVCSVMGVEKYACVPPPGSKTTAWEAFYTCSEPTRNPYASQLGGYQMMRFTYNNTPLIPESRTFLLRTTNVHVPQQENPCLTTAVLEELYNMSQNVDALTPYESAAIAMVEAQNSDSTGGMTFKTPRVESDTTGRPLLGKLDIPAILGCSVPYTQTTNQMLLESDLLLRYTPGGQARMMRGPADFCIVSPFTVPRLKSHTTTTTAPTH